MLGWTVTFFLLAIAAGVFGFSGLVGTFATVAQVLTILFAALSVISLVYGLLDDDQIHININ